MRICDKIANASDSCASLGKNFIKRSKASAGVSHRYARLAQSFRNANSQPRQRTIATLGRVDECG